MNEHNFVSKPQVPPTHYEEGYDTERRWSSYWKQIELALEAPNGPIAEIGMGNGVVAEYLRRVCGRDVTTVDIDPLLKPDVVADITALPFENNEFKCIMACEVLEHMPFEMSKQALKEMRRVSSTAIISLPNLDRIGELSVNMRLWRLKASFVLPFPRPKPKKGPSVVGQHYWEIGIKDYPFSRIQNVIEEAGWEIETEFRNRQHSFHHFLYLV